MAFSVIAIYKESFFRLAFISVEISYSLNFTIMWIFWFYLWPKMKQGGLDAIDNATTADEIMKIKGYMIYAELYHSTLHLVPFVSTVINLAITDMALNKRHWWIAVITMCPGYMVFNLWGSMTLGTTGPNGTWVFGTIYNIEQWITKPFITVVGFIALSLI